MATALETMPAIRRVIHRCGRKPGSVYDRYFDGQVWELTLGVDVDSPSVTSAMRAARSAAKTAGKSLRLTRTSGNTFALCVITE